MLPFILLYTVLGLCFGSFFAVIGLRWGVEEHKTRKWWSGRSQCDSCGRVLSWYELIPVFSYIMLRGKCRTCGEKIGFKPFFCELMCGFGWAALGIYSHLIFLENPIEAIIALIAVVYLSFAAVTDFMSHCIEAVSGYLAAIAIFALRIYSNWGSPSLKGYIIISAVIFAATLSAEWLNCNRVCGNGDIQTLLLMYFASGYLNMNSFISVIFYTIVLAGVFAAAAMIIKKGKTAVPFVPFYYLGYIVLMMAGPIQFIWERVL